MKTRFGRAEVDALREAVRVLGAENDAYRVFLAHAAASQESLVARETLCVCGHPPRVHPYGTTLCGYCPRGEHPGDMRIGFTPGPREWVTYEREREE